MRAVVDLDDTLCVTYDRDYAHSRPRQKAIERVRELHDAGFEIAIHTARGMHSCGGDARKAEEKNRPTIEAFLKKHGVPYDEIIFGKPLADVYIDDKAVSIRELEQRGSQVMKGYSGARVVRVGGMVVKEEKDAQQQRRWFEMMRKISPQAVPAIFCTQLGKIFMEYVDGSPLSYRKLTKDDIPGLVSTMAVFDSVRSGEHNEWSKYLEHVGNRAESCEIDCGGLLERLGKKLQSEKYKFKTFSHGDYTLLNIVEERETGRKVLIDPIVKPYVSHWILDAAKMRASIRGLDMAIDPRAVDNSAMLEEFDSYFILDLEVIKLLEKTHYLRVMHFAREAKDSEAERRLRVFYGEH